MDSIEKLYAEQLSEWDDFRKRVDDLDKIEIKKFDMGGYSVYIQHNPARIASSNAKTDKASIEKRKCFLCEANRPKIQKGVKLSDDFIALVNPFPILKGHLTISSIQHQRQEIKPYIADFVRFCRLLPNHTMLYNGPRCGASAPDHLHFQAVGKGQLPFEKEMQHIKKRELSEWNGSKMEEFVDYGRKCIHIQSDKDEKIISFFEQIYKQHQMMNENEEEPMMNLFGMYDTKEIHLFVFPRRKHRPSQFHEEGDRRMLISPGAIDIAGILVLPIRKDFDSITKETILDVYKQVSL